MVGEQRSIDLHGLRVREAIRRFVWFYNDCVRRGVQGPIEVVHGYGASSEGGGEIRRELRGFLAAHEDVVAGWGGGRWDWKSGGDAGVGGEDGD